jgi:hypothetical protein
MAKNDGNGRTTGRFLGSLTQTAIGRNSGQFWNASTADVLVIWKLPGEPNRLSFQVASNPRGVLFTGRHDAYRWPVDILAQAEGRKPREPTPEERARFEFD